MRLEGLVVVITGAGSGIGRALSAGFSRDGAYVVGFGRTAANLAQTARDSGNGRMDYVTGDVANAGDVDRLFNAVEQTHGRVDVLVNNAAVYPKQSFLEMTPDLWQSVMDINAVGMVRCMHRVLPGMLERGYGRIINIGSLGAGRALAGGSAYSASKAAVRGLTRAVAAEIDGDLYPDVLINELAPGTYRTQMSSRGGDPSEAYRYVRSLVELPAGGQTGQSFNKDEQVTEERRNVRRRVVRRLAGLVPAQVEAVRGRVLRHRVAGVGRLVRSRCASVWSGRRLR